MFLCFDNRKIFEHRIISIERQIYRKHRYSPDADFIRYMLEKCIIETRPDIDCITLDYYKLKETVKYLMGDECRADHGFAAPIENLKCKWDMRYELAGK